MAFLHTFLVTAGFADPAYTQLKNRIQKQNYLILAGSIIITSIILAALLIVSFVVPVLKLSPVLYCAFFLLNSALLLFLRYVVKQNMHLVPVTMYFFLSGVFLFTITLGVLHNAYYPAVSFCVLLFALPMLFIDRPWRMVLFLIFTTIGFCILSLHLLQREVAFLNILNGISFLLLSIYVNTFMIRIKLKEMMYSDYYKRVNDTDDLTKLLTKAAGKKQIQTCIEHNMQGALVIIDIDNFKSFNDTQGHAFGDIVIQLMASSIKNIFRSNDILSRFGGDEFFVYLPGAVETNIVQNKLTALHCEIERQFSHFQVSHEVTCSIGISFYPKDAGTYNELFEKADKALYCAKEAGKNRASFYSEP